MTSLPNHLHIPNFAQVRALVREIDDLDELKRIGGSLLGVAPSSQQASARAHILFLRCGLAEGGGSRESRTKLEEHSEFKLTREKRSNDEKAREASLGGSRKRPGRPFAIADPERVHYQLFKIDKSGGVTWVKVNV